jgi:cephalosporin hydroxylase
VSTADDFNRLWWEKKDQTFVPNTWLGVPCWQNPCDAWIIQEIIGETRPDVIVETGTLAGGGALLWASLLAMFGDGRVISIDVKPGLHRNVNEHPLVVERVQFVTGSSTDPDIVQQIAQETEGLRRMVILDSHHASSHVYRELDAWAPHVTEDCYLIVEDTWVDHVTEPDDPRRPGPADAVERWLPEHREFQVDRSRERLMLSFCPGGFLRRVP